MTKKLMSSLFILWVMHGKVSTGNIDYDRMKISNIYYHWLRIITRLSVEVLNNARLYEYIEGVIRI